MGLFKKSLADVEKYRAAQDTGKLTDTLTSKDPDIALAAWRALRELNKPESYEGMVTSVAASSHAELRGEFESFMSRNADAFSKPLAGALVAELKRLVLSGTLKAQAKQFIEGARPGSLLVLENWFTDFREAAAPEVRCLLKHTEFLVKILAAEILEKWDDPESSVLRRDILERRDIVYLNMNFDSRVLNNAMVPGEIPLSFASICTLSRKLWQLGLYTLGFTDEAIHILPEYGVTKGVKCGNWRIPLGLIQSAALSTEGLFVIDLGAPVIDPDDLEGPQTSRLRFKPFKKKDVVRAARIADLLDKLKKENPTKSEIAKTYFDKNNVSILTG